MAEIYLELIGARQAQLGLAESVERQRRDSDGIVIARQRSVPLMPRLSEAEREAHRVFIASLGDGAIWRNYLTENG